MGLDTAPAAFERHLLHPCGDGQLAAPGMSHDSLRAEDEHVMRRPRLPQVPNLWSWVGRARQPTRVGRAALRHRGDPPTQCTAARPAPPFRNSERNRSRSA